VIQGVTCTSASQYNSVWLFDVSTGRQIYRQASFDNNAALSSFRHDILRFVVCTYLFPQLPVCRVSGAVGVVVTVWLDRGSPFSPHMLQPLIHTTSVYCTHSLLQKILLSNGQRKQVSHL